MIAKDVYWLAVRVLLALGLTLLAVTIRASENTIPILHILAPDPCGAEQGQDTAAFTVFRDGPTNTSLEVAVQFGGSAINGVDYQRLAGTVTIPAGARRAPIVITPFDDNIVEGTEVVLAHLPQPLTWPLPYIVCWPSLAYAHIEDNDYPPTNHPPFVRIVSPEDGSVFVAPVDVTITAQASDRDGRVRTVEFFAGTNSLGIVSNYPIIRPLPVAVDADLEDASVEAEPDRYPDLDFNPDSIDAVLLSRFRLAWHDAPPGEHVLTAVAMDNHGDTSRSVPVTIKVTERPLQPVVTVTAPDPMAAEPGPASSRLDTATFRIHRSGNTDEPLTVYYRLGGTASNGVDYQELPYSVTIPRGSRATDVIVEPIDDNLVEGTEKVLIAIVPPICIAIWPPPPDCYLVGRPHSARAAIHDNDIAPGNLPPLVEIVRPLDGSIFRAQATIPLVAQARDPDGRVLTVEFFEGTNSLGIVTNDPGVITTSRPPFYLVWSNVPPGRYVLTAKATDNAGAVGRSRPVDVKVVDIVRPPVVTITTSDPEGAETGPIAAGDNAIVNTASFLVHRTGETGRPLVVYYSLSGSASNGVDYRRLSGEVTIPAGASSAPIQVIPIDDNLCEGTETVVATVEAPVCIAIYPPPPECYVVGDPRQARAVIRDNDPCPGNQPPRVAIVRPENGDIFSAPADIAIYAEAHDVDGRVVSVEFFANGTSIGIVSNSASNTDQLFRLRWPEVRAGGYRLTAMAKDNDGALTTSDHVDIKVIDVFRMPVVTIEATDPYASEGGRPFVTDSSVWPEIRDVATFVVKRDRATNHSLVVYYSLIGSAENGYDYEFLRGHVTIPAGEWGARVTVDPLDDDLVEGTETVIASLEPIACPRIIPPPPECYIVGEPARAGAYIRDNDFSNALPKIEIVEPQNGQNFAAPADIEINVVTRDRDGWVQTVQFFEGTNKLGEQSIFFVQPPPPGQVQRFSMIWSNVPPGAYVLTTVAIDNEGDSSRSDPVSIKVLDPCRLPVVTIEAVDPFAAEQDPNIDSLPDTATFRVKRTCVANTPLTVFLDLSGTAANAVDYHFVREHVTIPGGAASADIVIEAIDDLLIEGVETVVVSIESPVCLATDPAPAGCYLVGRASRDVAYIRDNDFDPSTAPLVAILSPSEGSTFVAPANIEIMAVALDPDGWVPLVEFFEGTNKIGESQIVFIQEPPPGEIQVHTFDWNNVPAGRYVLTAKATDNLGVSTVSGPIHISVVDSCAIPVVTVHAPDPIASEGNPDDTATFVVRRTCVLDEPMLVYYDVTGTAENGVDYWRLSGEVLFPAGDDSARIVVHPIDDSLIEGTETVIVTLIQPRCLNTDPPMPGCYLVGSLAGRASAYLRDNDFQPNLPPRVAIVRPRAGSIFHAPEDILITAKTRDADGWVTTMELYEGTNLIAGLAILVSEPPPPGEIQTFNFTWTDVAPGRYVLRAKATDNDGASSWSGPVEITVVDSTHPPVVTIHARDCYAIEGANPPNTATFVVRRSGPTNAPLTVHYAIGGTAVNGTDYVSLPTSVTIPAGNRAARIVVHPIDDRALERAETVVIELHNAALYNVGRPGRAGAIIADNDYRQPPTVCFDDRIIGLCLPRPALAVDPALALAPFSYRIEATTDLVEWTPVDYNTSLEDYIHFVDIDAPDFKMRFYRVMEDFDYPDDE